MSRKNSAPNLGSYVSDAGGGVRIGGKQDASGNEDSSKGSPDPEGPDTSSLSAFLINLLSSDKNGRGSSSPRSRLRHQSSEGMEDDANAQSGEFYDVDWLLVDDHVKVSDPVSVPPPRTQKKQLPSIAPDRLPRMSDHSCLLSADLRCSIQPALPTLAKGRRWVLLYSTEKHGMSLLTLYRNSKMTSGPVLLVAGDKSGAVFGGLITAPLEPSPRKKYQGTSDSFVFSNVTGASKIFHPTGVNRYYVLATSDALALGGGSHFALYLDAELLHGSSGECETYGCSCLANNEEFVLKHVELWGFDLTQRHSSFSGSLPITSWS